jgi:phosphoribosylanthranilate isomerase
MIVKAGQITNLTDARYFAAREVDYLGFRLEEGVEGALDPSFMHAIREWVQGPKITGEFTRATAGLVAESAAFFKLDAVQVPADAGMLDALRYLEQDILVWMPCSVGPQEALQLISPWKGVARYAVLDFSGVALEGYDWSVWISVVKAIPCLLHLDADYASWAAISGMLEPAGLSVTGGQEEQVGVKSFDEIDLIFEALGR